MARSIQPISASEVFDRWMKSLCADAMGRRNQRIDALKTPQDVAAWASQTRAWYRQQVGPLVKLRGKQRREFHGRVSFDGYSMEKWLFETMPGTFSPANLYVPARPNAQGVAIVAPLGHWAAGKAEPDYQRLGGFMACNGLAVLVYDHPGVGERREFWNALAGESRPGRSPTIEHDRTGDQALLAGIQPARFYLSELAAARELLGSFSFVQPGRIGVTGASGGGTLTRFAAAYFEDLAFAVPACIIRGEGLGGGDAEQCCWNAGLRGCATVDLLAAMAPRPAMIVTETSFDATRQSYASLRRIYDIAGAPASATAYFGVDDRHGYTHPMIEAVYDFLAVQFDLPKADRQSWQKVRPLGEAQTRVTRCGFVHRERVQVTLLEQIARACPRPRAPALTRKKLAEVLRIADLRRCPVAYAWRGRIAPAVVVTGASQAGPGELGLLDWLEPHPPEWYFRDEWLYRNCQADAVRALRDFDRCLLGLRVRQVLDFLQDHPGRVRRLQADGPWSLPVAFAAALAGPRLLKAATVGCLPGSFGDFITAEPNTTPSAMYVPGLLGYGDMDDVIALAGKRLCVQRRVDADGRVVEEGHRS